ncbi:hypothetical protein Pint_35556 [Pistacia integerrima]|uniref:Uncharacterized protein n=1 Tax=Pistacia integerrima TaxID=434235 RepID=A0ACC0Y3P9_9ROSI|nr:hypothetical protein Pint_35556 [Pistacia integerrima]
MEKLNDCCWRTHGGDDESLTVLPMERFAPRFYIAAATDNMSLQNAHVFEDSLVHKNGIKGSSARFMHIYRSREVGRSYITSVWTTLLAIAHALWLMIRIRPQWGSLQLTWDLYSSMHNCIFILGHENRWSSVFYVESTAKRKYPRARYVGCLIYYNCSIVDSQVKLYTSYTGEIQKPLVAFTKEDRGPPSRHSSFFSSVKQVEKRLTLEHQTEHPSPTQPVRESNSKFKSSTEPLGSRIYLHLDQTHNNSNLQESGNSEAPQVFLSLSSKFPPSTQQSPPQINSTTTDDQESNDVDDIKILMQLLVKRPECEEWRDWRDASNGDECGFGGLEFPSTIDEFLKNDPPKE